MENQNNNLILLKSVRSINIISHIINNVQFISGLLLVDSKFIITYGEDDYYSKEFIITQNNVNLSLINKKLKYIIK